MTENTKIEWAHHTMNFWTGCEPVSPGCAGCYAETWAKRAGRVFAERKRTTPANWRQPFKWDTRAKAEAAPARVFTNSLADFFDNKVPEEWRAEAFAVIRATPHLHWLVLTKRIGNALSMIERAADWHFDHGDRNVAGWLTDWYRHRVAPANVWLGATVVNQAEVGRDIPKLLKVPARVRFLSCEPLLEQVFIGDALATGDLHWVIVGGESGPKSRPFHVEWSRTLVAQCQFFGARAFVKQFGAVPYDLACRSHDWPGRSSKDASREMDGSLRVVLADRKGGDLSEWPIGLRVRQFPEVA